MSRIAEQSVEDVDGTACRFKEALICSVSFILLSISLSFTQMLSRFNLLLCLLGDSELFLFLGFSGVVSRDSHNSGLSGSRQREVGSESRYVKPTSSKSGRVSLLCFEASSIVRRHSSVRCIAVTKLCISVSLSKQPVHTLLGRPSSVVNWKRKICSLVMISGSSRSSFASFAWPQIRHRLQISSASSIAGNFLLRLKL